MITEHKPWTITDGRVLHENKRPMNSSDLEKDIAAIPFLQGMRARHLAILAACAGRIHFKENQIIFRKGEAANRFYLIEDGMVELESTKRGIVAGSISSGEALGWSWLIPPYEWQFTARALRETRAIFFCAIALREHCEADPSLGLELFKRMAAKTVKRLQTPRMRLLDSGAGFSPIGDERAFGSEPRFVRRAN